MVFIASPEDTSLFILDDPVTTLRDLSIRDLIGSKVDWICETIEREEAPGLIVGLSGTDSILTYILCLEAFKKLGKPLKNVRGVNFQHQTQDKFVEMNAPFVCTMAHDTKWVEREIFPWIKHHYPDAGLEVDRSITHSKDGARWGAIHDKAKEEVNGRGDMISGTYYFPVGTRNATEQALGAHTLITSAVSLFPIIDIYKTEVIDLCRFFSVPKIAIDKSQDIDCDCGRFEIQVFHMLELDQLLMFVDGHLQIDIINQIDPTLRHDVGCFIREEKLLNEFKGRTPYLPAIVYHDDLTQHTKAYKLLDHTRPTPPKTHKPSRLDMILHEPDPMMVIDATFLRYLAEEYVSDDSGFGEVKGSAWKQLAQLITSHVKAQEPNVLHITLSQAHFFIEEIVEQFTCENITDLKAMRRAVMWRFFMYSFQSRFQSCNDKQGDYQ